MNSRGSEDGHEANGGQWPDDQMTGYQSISKRQLRSNFRHTVS